MYTDVKNLLVSLNFKRNNIRCKIYRHSSVLYFTIYTRTKYAALKFTSLDNTSSPPSKTKDRFSSVKFPYTTITRLIPFSIYL